jgi:hypothetical protein
MTTATHHEKALNERGTQDAGVFPYWITATVLTAITMFALWAMSQNMYMETVTLIVIGVALVLNMTVGMLIVAITRVDRSYFSTMLMSLLTFAVLGLVIVVAFLVYGQGTNGAAAYQTLTHDGRALLFTVLGLIGALFMTRYALGKKTVHGYVLWAIALIMTSGGLFLFASYSSWIQLYKQ